MVPALLDERVNSRLSNIPQEISIIHMLPYLALLRNKPRKLPDYCSSEICKHYQSTNISLINKKLKSKAILIAGVPNVANLKQKAINTNKPLMNLKHLRNDKLLKIAAAKKEIDQKSSVPRKIDQKSAIVAAKISNKFPQREQMTMQNRSWQRMEKNARLADINNNNQWEQCADCDNEANEILSYYSDYVMNRIQNNLLHNLLKNNLSFLRRLFQTCVSDLALSTYLLGSSTTNYDLTFSLVGEFSPNTRGGTPFGPPLLQFPILDSGQMIDILVSDYTFNSLLYHLHRFGIFSKYLH
ncbi:unnamed protein product [Onchocerca flexuosa]|uniref:BPI2 domain-containing protein n=1 Tax=Onchocerca flexuosa TaxID=387005 RepID=A0A183HGS8_9BILA|nr:unnamed protein product [Onchocerca flexuosa]